MGATILPVAPVLAELERGAHARPAHPQPVDFAHRGVVRSKNIPLTNAAAAVPQPVAGAHRSAPQRARRRHAGPGATLIS